MILICGIPNAGKTTLSKYFRNRVHSDDIKLHGRSRISYICNLIELSDDNICIEGVFGLSRDRIRFIQASKGRKTCIWVDTPEEICIEREKNYRGRPLTIIFGNARTFQPPTYSEGWDRIIKVHDNQIEEIEYE